MIYSSAIQQFELFVHWAIGRDQCSSQQRQIFVEKNKEIKFKIMLVEQGDFVTDFATLSFMFYVSQPVGSL